MNLATTNAIFAGGPGSGRHKYAVGQRVMRNPKQKAWSKGTEHDRGSVISQEISQDNSGRNKLAYRFRSDHDAGLLKDPNTDKYDRPNPRGVMYLEQELVPETGKAT